MFSKKKVQTSKKKNPPKKKKKTIFKKKKKKKKKKNGEMKKTADNYIHPTQHICLFDLLLLLSLLLLINSTYSHICSSNDRVSNYSHKSSHTNKRNRACKRS